VVDAPPASFSDNKMLSMIYGRSDLIALAARDPGGGQRMLC
jgi:hypothetical protein